MGYNIFFLRPVGLECNQFISLPDFFFICQEFGKIQLKSLIFFILIELRVRLQFSESQQKLVDLHLNDFEIFFNLNLTNWVASRVRA